MDGFTFLTIVLTVVAVIVIERLYAQKKSGLFGDEAPSAAKTSYREEAFNEIIKINEESIQHGRLDSITGLPGREIFDDRLKKILAHSKTYNQIFSVLVLNIDEFNTINRVYGNSFGNKLLAETSHRLRTVLRQIDTVARYVGDSFFCILPELSNPEVAVLVAQRIQDSIIQPFTIEDHRIFVTASIGIAIFSPEVEDSDKLMRHAEQALAKAKLAGRNTYRIHNQSEFKSFDSDAGLATYFKTNAFIEKMIMHYQPFMNAAEKKTEIIQAIPYFNHPELGLMPYQKIIQAIEDNERLHELGKWQLEKILAQVNHWQVNGYTPNKIMVSVTLKQIQDIEFVNRVSNMIKQAGIEKGRMIFDITQFNIKANNHTFKEVLRTVQEVGIEISFNLMALGRLALHNILEFPVNYLKIDEKLTKGLILNIDNEAIIGSLVIIAKTADVKVIAEGVDFENQKNKLEELGCDVMKGRMFSPPVSANEVFDMEISRLHENKLVT